MIKPISDIAQNTSYYLDPGTLSLVTQVLIAAFVGTLFMLRVYWTKAKAFLQKLRKR